MSQVTRSITIFVGFLACWLMPVSVLGGGLANAVTSSSSPSAYTGQASATAITTATVTGSVYPGNHETSYYFQYGTTTAYGAQTPTAAVAAGTQSVRVSGAIAGLSAGITYHYRLVVVNSVATVDGQDRVFITKKVPLMFTLHVVTHHQVYGTPFSVSGELQGTGNASHPVVLQTNPFPFLAGFKNVGVPVLTDAAGHFTFPKIALTSNTQLRVATLETPPVRSTVVVELIGVRVTVHVRSSGRPGWAEFYGTVTPAEAGASVNIQLVRRHHSPRTLAATTLKSSGKGPSRFSCVVRIRHAGLYRAHVRVLSGAQFSNSSSLILIR